MFDLDAVDLLVRTCLRRTCPSSGPLGGGRNLQVLNPSMTTLEVRWEPAEGKVTEYKVVYAPAAGGPKSTVGRDPTEQ